MRKILLDDLPYGMPEELINRFEGCSLYDSSCSPEARVYYADTQMGYYIKTARAGTLRQECDLTRYFYSIGYGVEVCDYISGDSDWLVTRAAKGEDCTNRKYLDDPKRLCDILGESLRMLHETPFGSCPVQNRIETYTATVDSNFSVGMFDRELFAGSVYEFKNAREAYAVFVDGRDALESSVLLHGDYCLPNIILDDWRLSAFIDVGNGGAGDRHIDLFWALWTLWFNLKTDIYSDRILDAYGRDKVSNELLRVVAAAETFG